MITRKMTTKQYHRPFIYSITMLAVMSLQLTTCAYTFSSSHSRLQQLPSRHSCSARSRSSSSSSTTALKLLGGNSKQKEQLGNSKQKDTSQTATLEKEDTDTKQKDTNNGLFQFWGMSSDSSSSSSSTTTTTLTSSSSSSDKKSAITTAVLGDALSGGSRGKFKDMKDYLRAEEDEIVKDVTQMEEEGEMLGVIVAAVGALVLGLTAAMTVGMGVDISIPNPTDTYNAIQTFLSNPTETLQSVTTQVQSMGNLGLVYFGVVYTVAEILAIPAIPLTASAGYLFGVTGGTAVVLLSASVAAAVSFIIGRTLLRGYVESMLDEYPKFRKIDGAIGREGFKLMLLLRLSPIFPFALSNYLYGATSVKFWPYFWGTMLGFAPGTLAYVYAGEVGKALTLPGSGEVQPWYVYAGGLALVCGILKVVADVATGVIDNMEDEDAL
mmetsp:Transcript_35574/g.52149  ORF Transcript_35574/g.52149 Transcript_35574/m.52149 type:complete len:438 (+) Transcript_35574:181-1494(+)